MEWNTFGHDHVKDILAQQLSVGHFSHAYFFVGSEGLGKRTLAHEFAQLIRGDRTARHDADILQTTVSSDFGVANMRDWLAAVKFKPTHGTYKIAILDNADALNTESANALLKTLEEPSLSTILILIARSRAVPLTILSRCQVFTFNRLTEDALKQFAEQRDIAVNEQLLVYSFGSPGKLVALSQDKAKLSALVAVEQEFIRLMASSLQDRLLAATKLAALDTADLEVAFSVWQWYVLRHYVPLSSVFLSWLRQVQELSALLRTSANKKFIMQRLVLALPASVKQ